MLIINYTQSGRAVSDYSLRVWADGIIKECETLDAPDLTIKVCTETQVDIFRVMLAEGRLTVNDIRFEFEGEPLNVNKYGRIEYWPKGFCGIQLNLVGRILRGASRARKQEVNLEENNLV